MLRLIRETNPTWVIGENVRGLLTWNGGMVLDEVFADLEGLNYEVGAFVIPAVAVNAPHRRDRVWIVAHSISGRRWARGQSVELEAVQRAWSHHASSSTQSNPWREDWPEVAARLCALDDGLPAGLVRPKGWRNAALKAAGNAIVPQVAEEVMRAMLRTIS